MPSARPAPPARLADRRRPARTAGDDAPDDDVEDGRQEQTEERDAEHAGEHRDAHRAGESRRRRRSRTRAARTPMMNAIDVISTGRSRTRHASRIAVTRSAPSSSRCLRELDDQDGVLARQAGQHEEADLREDVVVAAGQPDAGDRGQQRHRHDQDDAERQRPALVLRRQHDVDQQHAQREDQQHRVARRSSADTRARSTRRSCRAAAARSAPCAIAVLRLTGAEAGRRTAVDLGGREAVVVHHLVGPVAADSPRRASRAAPSSPLRVARLQARDLFGLQPERRLGLHVDLVGAAEAVEVVDVERARDRPAASRRRRSAARRRSWPARDRRAASICGTLTWKLESSPASAGSA